VARGAQAQRSWSDQALMATARIEEHVGEWKLTITADSLEELFVEASRIIARECGPTQGQLSECRGSRDGRPRVAPTAQSRNRSRARTRPHERSGASDGCDRCPAWRRLTTARSVEHKRLSHVDAAAL
jgi:hypothetical protein